MGSSRAASTGLLTDHYELTMLSSWVTKGTVEDRAVFECFGRRLPEGRRYGMVAGLGRLLPMIEDFRFGEDDVAWLEEHLPALNAGCRALLDADSRFLFLTVYAVRMSALAIGEVVRQALADRGGTVEVGEMAVREEARGLLLPTAIFARWAKD